MSKTTTMRPNDTSSEAGKTASQTTNARLFFLDLSEGRVMSCNPDGSDLQTIVSQAGHMPDGVVIDEDHGHIYWTNMGTLGANDGSIRRSNLDGTDLTTIVPAGGTHTAKQLQLDKKNHRLYWCDREGMRVMRVNLNGSNLETLIETGHSDEDRRDARNWCVGIALDIDCGHLYWTQKGSDNAGQGRIFRAGMDIPKGQTPSTRKDIELLYGGLPEPIDLDLDLANRTMYWTDRGDPPRGNTVNRAPMDAASGGREDPQIIFTHLMEGIGLALDLKNSRMFMTDLGGSVYRCGLDGANTKILQFAKGNLSGIAYAEIPSPSASRGNP